MNIFKNAEVKKEISPENLFNSIRKDIVATQRKKTISNTMVIGGVASFAGGATTGTIGGPLAISLPLVIGGLGVSITSAILGSDYADQVEYLEHRLDMFKKNSLEKNPTRLIGSDNVKVSGLNL